jgi:hypothetical protein
MPLLSLCRAIPIDSSPSAVRTVVSIVVRERWRQQKILCLPSTLQCLDFPNFGSWSDGFAREIELRDADRKKRTVKHGSEALEGDLVTFRGSRGKLEAIIVDNTPRMFSFQSLDETTTIYWEFVPLPPRNANAGEPERTFFKHWEYQKSKPTHFWERHGPFKTANEEELDRFNEALKRECESRIASN